MTLVSGHKAGLCVRFKDTFPPQAGVQLGPVARLWADSPPARRARPSPVPWELEQTSFPFRPVAGPSREAVTAAVLCRL